MIGLLVFAAALKVGVAFDSGDALLQSCLSTSRRPFCAGYISGIADLMAYSTPPSICLKAKTNEAELVRLVVKQIETDPGARKGAPHTSVIAALATAFPCAKKTDAPAK
jgi:hypothetical protein